jgi:glycosyltransferase involved in cell wall biosynthesis
VTSYIPGKGICRLLRSLKDLQQFPWSLRLVGNRDFDPNYAAAVEEMADRFGLRGRIRLFGAVPHRTVNLLMLQADLLVHFSLNESYSMVTAEAIAAGLPTLSHKTGNYPHFRHSGLVSYVDCDRRSRTDALRTLISDSDAYTRLRKTQPYSQRTWSDVGSEFMSWLAKT